jgi:uncharacterized protein (TIGR03435 family)
LKIHREQKSMQGFALVAAKSGFKLKPVTSNELPNMHSTGRVLTAEHWPMERMASFLESLLSQPVVNMTHIDGIYDLKLEWTPEDVRNRAPSDPTQAPSIFTALEEQLGLKLEPQKVPIEIIVVESAERPSEN